MKSANAVNPSPPIAIIEPISRLLAFVTRHGFRATLSRFGVFLKRMFSNRMVLFYLDLQQSGIASASLPKNLTVERKTSSAGLSAGDREKIVNFWNPMITQKNLTERFGHGASLWLIRSEGQLAGYGWTMTGQTIEPHYHPLSAGDVHMFDFLVFPEFRGKKINPSLVEYILAQMTQEGRTRAFIEVREWNQPQLQSLRKTKFQLLGVARKTSLFGRALVVWIPEERAGIVRQPSNQSHPANQATPLNR